MLLFFVSLVFFSAVKSQAQQLSFLESPFCYGFDLSKADLVVIDSDQETWVPTSSNPNGQFVYIRKGGGQIFNVGTNAKTRVLNDGESSSTLFLSALKPPSTEIDVEDNHANLIWGDFYPLENGFISTKTQKRDALQEASILQSISRKARFNLEKADLLEEMGASKIVSAPPSLNKHGILIHMMKQGNIINIGTAKKTFLSCTAKEGPVFYSTLKSISPDHQLIVYNSGNLVMLNKPEGANVGASMSFRQKIDQQNFKIDWIPSLGF